MPLLRHTKLPPPPELGGRTLWQSLPRHTPRRVLFLLLALGAVVFLKRTGGGSFGGLLDAMSPPRATRRSAAEPGQAPVYQTEPGETPVYHLRVTGPAPARDDKSHP